MLWLATVCGQAFHRLDSFSQNPNPISGRRPQRLMALYGDTPPNSQVRRNPEADLSTLSGLYS